MIQYQTEKIRMFDAAINRTSSSKALTASEADPKSTAKSALVWANKASVKRALAAMIDQKSACLRFKIHRTTSTATKPNRRATKSLASWGEIFR